MSLSDADRAFIDAHPGAAMITVKADGTPHAVRVGLAVVDGKLWSSGTSDRARTAHLRRDPRCTLFVFDSAFASLTLETTATILDGPEAPQLSLALFRKMQGKPTGPLSWFGGELDDAEFK